MRLLGLDYGRRRVGVAMSNPEGTMAFPRPALTDLARPALLARIAGLARDEGVTAVVLGLPLQLDGQDSDTTREVRGFARELEAATGLAVHLEDERLTSAEAEVMLREAGVRAKKMRDKVDSQAAVLILEGFLERRRLPEAR